jgi:hypothetical protein
MSIKRIVSFLQEAAQDVVYSIATLLSLKPVKMEHSSKQFVLDKNITKI